MLIKRIVAVFLTAVACAAMLTQGVAGYIFDKPIIIIGDEPTDEVLIAAGMEQASGMDINIGLDMACDGNGRTMAIGNGTRGFRICFSDNGKDFSLINTDLEEKASAAALACFSSTFEVIELPYSVHCFDSAFYVLFAYADGTSIVPVLASVDVGGSASVKALPAIKGFNARDTVGLIFEKRGGTYILAAKNYEFEPGQAVRASFLTSGDLSNWKVRTTPEQAAAYNKRSRIKVEEISPNGTVLFKDCELNDSGFGTVRSFFCTGNYSDYSTLGSAPFAVNRGGFVDVSVKSSPSGNAVYAMRTESEKNQRGDTVITATELWSADSYNGNWVKQGRHEGQAFGGYVLTVTDRGGSVLLEDYDEHVTYVYSCVSGSTQVYVTDVDLAYHYDRIVYYGELVIIKENGTFVCTADNWNTMVRVDFPEMFSEIAGWGDKIYICSRNLGGAGRVISAGNVIDAITCGGNISVIPHKYGLVSHGDATCLAEGYDTYSCAVCGESYTDSIPAKGHDFAVLERVDPACESEGSEHRRCNTCGLDETVTLAAVGHSYEVVSQKEAGCTEDGLRTEKCSACEHTSETVLPKTGHSYEVKSDVPATCEKDGETVKRCTVCSAEDSVKTEALGHDYEVKKEEPASCESDGYKDVVCRTCEKADRLTIPAVGHTFGEGKVLKAPGLFGKGSEELICEVDPTHVEVRSLRDLTVYEYKDAHPVRFTFLCVGAVIVVAAVTAVAVFTVIFLKKRRGNTPAAEEVEQPAEDPEE